MFHTAISELKPKDLEMMESTPLSLLPKGFNYYAGGHVHIIKQEKIDGYGTITYPGALFPNNFAELEKYKHGGFYIIDDKLNLKYIKINLKEVRSCNINVDNKRVEDIEKEIEKIGNFKDKILLLRIYGCLKEGKVSDINFKKLLERFKDAYIVLRNTSKLTSKEFEELNLEEEDIEENIVKKHLENLDFKEDFVFSLMNVLSKEKNEDEKNIDFEKRLLKESFEILKLK